MSATSGRILYHALSRTPTGSILAVARFSFQPMLTWQILHDKFIAHTDPDNEPSMKILE
jgi:hypothetical protein